MHRRKTRNKIYNNNNNQFHYLSILLTERYVVAFMLRHIQYMDYSTWTPVKLSTYQNKGNIYLNVYLPVWRWVLPPWSESSGIWPVSWRSCSFVGMQVSKRSTLLDWELSAGMLACLWYLKLVCSCWFFHSAWHLPVIDLDIFWRAVTGTNPPQCLMWQPG